MEQDISFINNNGVVLRGNPFLLAGFIVQSRNDDTINTPLPKPRIFATRGTLPRKNVKKIVQNQQKIRRRGLGDSPRQTGDSGMVFAHKGHVKGFCEEAKRRQKFAKTLFCAYLAPRNININS